MFAGVLVADRLIGPSSGRSAASNTINGTVPASPPPTTGTSEQSLVWDGITRTWEVYVPPGTPPGAHLPLLVMLHAAGATANTFVTNTGMETYAQRYHFVVVAPTGVAETWNAGDCCGSARDQGVDDIGFINAMLNQVINTEPVDQGQMYVAGASNGGMLAYTLACRLAFRFQAVFSAGGAQTLPDCQPTNPISIVEFHSDSDSLVPFAGGVAPKYAADLTNFVSGLTTFNLWSHLDQCPTYTIARAGKGEDVQIWYGCADHALLEIWLRTTGGGHEWPLSPGAPVDASATIAKAISSGSLVRGPGASPNPLAPSV